jgi:hypothetical protein
VISPLPVIAPLHCIVQVTCCRAGVVTQDGRPAAYGPPSEYRFARRRTEWQASHHHLEVMFLDAWRVLGADRARIMNNETNRRAARPCAIMRHPIL